MKTRRKLQLLKEQGTCTRCGSPCVPYDSPALERIGVSILPTEDGRCGLCHFNQIRTSQ